MNPSIVGQIFKYAELVVQVWTEFEAGQATTVQVPLFSFMVGSVKIDIGPFALPIKKG